MPKYAIIGFGCAGYHAAQSIRNRDSGAEIDVFSSSSLPPSNPMLTTYFVKGDIDWDVQFPFGSLNDIVNNLRLQLHGDEIVKSIELLGKKVRTEKGIYGPYDSILISTGASAFVPPIPGIDLPGVLVMRTVEDSDRLRCMLDLGKVKSAIIIGASMTGIKIAEMMVQKEIRTTMVDGAGWMFPLAAFESTARRIEKVLSDKGVELAFGAMLSEIKAEGDKLNAIMKDGRVFSGDVVLACIGTRANTEIAKISGVDVNRGIVVDAHMKTSSSDIYAAGDCCEAIELQSGETRVIGLWANAGQQGRIAGENMTGGDSIFKINIAQNISHFMGIDFIGIGSVDRCGSEDLFYEHAQDEKYIKACKKNDGMLQCINMLGYAKQSGIVRNRLIKQWACNGELLDTLTYCQLKEGGLPESFIEFIGGSNNV